MAWIAPPDANRAAGSTHACTSGGGGASLGANMGDPVAALRELLGAFFAAYLEDATELRKRRMSTLLVQADARGLLGPGAVRPLTSLFVSLEREMQVDAQRFAAFYHFVFFVARERGHRNLSFGTAVDSWRFVLGGGRFALLGPWCDFVSGRAGSKGVSEDTWCQVRLPSSVISSLSLTQRLQPSLLPPPSFHPPVFSSTTVLPPSRARGFFPATTRERGKNKLAKEISCTPPQITASNPPNTRTHTHTQIDPSP